MSGAQICFLAEDEGPKWGLSQKGLCTWQWPPFSPAHTCLRLSLLASVPALLLARAGLSFRALQSSPFGSLTSYVCGTAAQCPFRVSVLLF